MKVRLNQLNCIKKNIHLPVLFMERMSVIGWLKHIHWLICFFYFFSIIPLKITIIFPEEFTPNHSNVVTIASSILICCRRCFLHGLLQKLSSTPPPWSTRADVVLKDWAFTTTTHRLLPLSRRAPWQILSDEESLVKCSSL